MVASIPSFPNTTGSGTLLQSTSFTWQPNTDYTFTFYLGIPTGDIAPQGALAVFFLENGVQDGLPRFDLTGSQVPTAGHWVLDTLSFHTASSGAAYLGQPIGVEFFASTTLVRACRAWWRLALVFSAWHAADVAEFSDPSASVPATRESARNADACVVAAMFDDPLAAFMASAAEAQYQ
jgi:hypothetical protein